MILSRRRRSDARQKFLPAIFLSPIVVAKFIFFAPNLLFLRILRQWRSVARTLREAIMTSQIQHFEADFQWQVSLKILNSRIILKTYIHAVIHNSEFKWSIVHRQTENKSEKLL